jgi:metallo-beta-lactamase class B
MRQLTKRRWIILWAGMVCALALLIGPKWLAAVRIGGQKRVEPFQIAGNLYYVGTNDITAFLLTGPEGHVLIGDGREASAPMIIESIAKLGFDIADVKVLLNSHPHFDHAGALAALQKASGAELWISEPDAYVVAAGGAGDSSLGRNRFLTYIPFFRYPPPRIDHRFKDGATIHLGPLAVTAHITAGHTPGSTSWSFPVRDGDRELLAVSVCYMGPPLAMSRAGPDPYLKVRTDFERSFRTLRSLPADIFLASHAREFGRWRKLQQRAKAKNPADPFIDRAGYLSFLTRWETIDKEWLAERERRP